MFKYLRSSGPSGSTGTTNEAGPKGQDRARAQDPGPKPPLLWLLGILRLPLDLHYLSMGPNLLISKTVPWSPPTLKSLSSYKIDMATYLTPEGYYKVNAHMQKGICDGSGLHLEIIIMTNVDVTVDATRPQTLRRLH